MENAELSSLLSKNNLFFQWSEVTFTWRLSPQKRFEDNLEGSQSYTAPSIEAAQDAAIQILNKLPMPEYDLSSNQAELDTLLRKYRLTFNWANPGLKWWLVGQNKGSNALARTVPQGAKDIETAKADAVKFILAMYRTSPQENENR